MIARIFTCFGPVNGSQIRLILEDYQELESHTVRVTDMTLMGGGMNMNGYEITLIAESQSDDLESRAIKLAKYLLNKLKHDRICVSVSGKTTYIGHNSNEFCVADDKISSAHKVIELTSEVERLQQDLHYANRIISVYKKFFNFQHLSDMAYIHCEDGENRWVPLATEGAKACMNIVIETLQGYMKNSASRCLDQETKNG